MIFCLLGRWESFRAIRLGASLVPVGALVGGAAPLGSRFWLILRSEGSSTMEISMGGVGGK